MKRMPRSWSFRDDQPCLWMAAGLLSYRLCDRDFDCEHCPLDAAMRGDSRLLGLVAQHIGGRPPGSHFPDDRYYAGGHTWIRLEGTTAHLGLDAFAANMLDGLLEVRATRDARTPGEPVAELRLDSGSVPIGLPVATAATTSNPLLQDEPTLVLTAPYGDGWLCSLTEIDADGLDALLDAEAALEMARQDLRLFRRRVALEMLADSDDLGRCMADGGEPLTDLRQMLGPLRFCALLRELVH